MSAAGLDHKYSYGSGDGGGDGPCPTSMPESAFGPRSYHKRARATATDPDFLSDDTQQHSRQRVGHDDLHIGRHRAPQNIDGFVPPHQPTTQSLPFEVKTAPAPIIRCDEEGNILVGEEQTGPISSQWNAETLTVSRPDVKTNHTTTTELAVGATGDELGRRMGHLSMQEAITLEEKEQREEEDKCAKDAEMGDATLGEYAPLIESLTKHHLAMEAEKVGSMAFRERRKVILEPRIGAMCAGEVRYRAVLAMFRRLAKLAGFVLEPTQIEFIEEFIASCAPLIYGEDWNTNSLDWRKKYRRWKVHYQVMCLTPRRFGKTTSVVLFVVAMALIMPKIKIVILSQNLRASQLLLGECAKLLALVKQKDPAHQERLGVNSKTEITVIPEDESRNSTAESRKHSPNAASIKAFPSTADGTRTHAPHALL